jgi:hypothetical protein
MSDQMSKRPQPDDLSGHELLLWQAIRFQLMEHNQVHVSSLGAVFKIIQKLKHLRWITLGKCRIHAHCYKIKPTVIALAK